MESLRYAYYPGCSLGTSAKEYDLSLRVVFERLGVELVDIEGWNCCGATPATQDELLAYSLSARNLAWAEERGLDVVAPCSACFKNLHKAAVAVKEDHSMRDEVNAILGNRTLRGSVKVKHPLEVVVRDVGLDRVKALVTRPQAGMQIAPYYGCLITRPRNDFDRPDDPTALDDLIVALGAEAVDYYPYKTKCCGGGLLLSQKDLALSLTRALIVKAKERGANGMILGCPMCDMMLDAYQGPALGRGEKPIPILYFTQLMGLAFGMAPEQLGMDSRVVSPRELLATVV